MKKTICFMLLLSILLNGCISDFGATSNPKNVRDERRQEINEIVAASCAVVLITWIVLIIHASHKNKANHRAVVHEGKN